MPEPGMPTQVFLQENLHLAVLGKDPVTLVLL
jgi:hypothetical protein